MIYKILIIALISLIYASCTKSSVQVDIQDNSNMEVKEVKNIFIPDVQINNLKLVNPESITKNLGDLKGKVVEDDSLPHVIFFNKNKTQKLYLVLFPGSGYNDIYQFRVERNISEQSNNINTLNDSQFVTESGISLGIDKSKLIELKGSNYVEGEGNDIIVYQITESKNMEFLQQYNMPIYYAKYVFVDEKLDKFEFGFEYP